MAVVSQPCDTNCNLSQPGEIDDELNEFWVGDPWMIFREHNLSCFERNRLFMNVGGRKFLDASVVSGADDDGDARASIAVDVNHDGMLELVVRQAGGPPLLLYENRFPARNYLKVTLRGLKSNRLGIGARVVAHVGERQIVRECFPINSYLSQAPVALHFGLGEAEQIDRLAIAWPSGEEQEVRDVAANQHIAVTEGNDEIAVVIPGQVIAP